MPATWGDRRGLPAGPAAGLARVLPAVVVAIVVGILGMHALGSSHAMAMNNMDHSSGPAVMTSQKTDEVIGGVGSADHDMATMMMLCGAMLTSAGALLLALFGWRRFSHVWARRSPGTSLRAGPLPTRIARTGPPTVWEFSVIRC